MKSSCRIIEDLLPIYHDGICSDESAALVEDHLKSCPKCSQMLASLDGEFELEKPQAADDLKPLEGIREQIVREKKRSGRRGAILTLCAMLSVFVLWVGIWYFGYGIHYDRLAKPLERIPHEISDMTTAGHTLEVGEHRIVLKHPGFLGEGGFIRVGDKEGMTIFLDEGYNQIGQNKEVWLDLFFYPEFGGGYQFALSIDDGQTPRFAWLTRELTYDYDLNESANRPEEEIEVIENLLTEHREEIEDLFDTVKKVWGIEFH